MDAADGATARANVREENRDVVAHDRATEQALAALGYRLLAKISTQKMSTIWRATRLRPRADDSSGSVECAVKVYRGNDPLAFERDVQMTRAVQSHPNIVAFRTSFIDSTSAMVMDFHSGGDLFDVIVGGSLASNLDGGIKNIARDLLSALIHVHARGIAHRDVKPENIVAAEDGRYILIDFGIAAFISDQQSMSSKACTLGFVAPEVIVGAQYSTPVDVFSLGCVLYFCVCRRHPFSSEHNSMERICAKTVECRIKYGSSFERVSEDCRAVIASLLSRKVCKRPTAREASGFKWFDPPEARVGSESSPPPPAADADASASPVAEILPAAKPAKAIAAAATPSTVNSVSPCGTNIAAMGSVTPTTPPVTALPGESKKTTVPTNITVAASEAEGRRPSGFRTTPEAALTELGFAVTRDLSRRERSSVFCATQPKRPGVGAGAEAQEVAVKVYTCIDCAQFDRVVQMTNAVQGHPNVVALRSHFMDAMALEMDYYSSGDLFDIVVAKRLEPQMPGALARIAKDLLSALVHIHKLEILHRDVKPENVVMAADGGAVLIDFGVAAYISDQEDMGNKGCTVGYAAPESIMLMGSGPPADVFSLGCVLHFVVRRRHLFSCKDNCVETICSKTVECKVKFGPSFNCVGKEAVSMMQGMLQRKPEKRPTAAQALQSAFLASPGNGASPAPPSPAVAEEAPILVASECKKRGSGLTCESSKSGPMSSAVEEGSTGDFSPKKSY